MLAKFARALGIAASLATFWCKNRGLGLVARIAVLAGNCKVGRISDDDRSDWADCVGAERLGSGRDGGPEAEGPSPEAQAAPGSRAAPDPSPLAEKSFAKAAGAQPRISLLYQNDTR